MPNIIREGFDYYIAPMRVPGFYVPDGLWGRYLAAREAYNSTKPIGHYTRKKLANALYLAKQAIHEYEPVDNLATQD